MNNRMLDSHDYDRFLDEDAQERAYLKELAENYEPDDMEFKNEDE